MVCWPDGEVGNNGLGQEYNFRVVMNHNWLTGMAIKRAGRSDIGKRISREDKCDALLLRKDEHNEEARWELPKRNSIGTVSVGERPDASGDHACRSVCDQVGS